MGFFGTVAAVAIGAAVAPFVLRAIGFVVIVCVVAVVFFPPPREEPIYGPEPTVSCEPTSIVVGVNGDVLERRCGVWSITGRIAR